MNDKIQTQVSGVLQVLYVQPVQMPIYMSQKKYSRYYPRNSIFAERTIPEK